MCCAYDEALNTALLKLDHSGSTLRAYRGRIRFPGDIGMLEPVNNTHKIAQRDENVIVHALRCL